MTTAAAPRPLAWPPPDLPLAPRIWPERADRDSENALDRWVAGQWTGRLGLHPLPAALRQRRWAAWLRGVEAQQPRWAAADDAALRRAIRSQARAAFTRADPQAVAAVLAPLREVARRTLGLWPHPPQLVAAWQLVAGRFVELDTGEGKTLTAALAAAVAGAAGVPAHVVTVNDYLAQRDAQTLAPLFGFLGLRVGVVASDVPPAERAAAYGADITYCTNKDLVFDYLRDRVSAPGHASAAQLALRRLHGQGGQGPDGHTRLRGLHYAIVDEADSVLIDEARTPLILSRQQGATLEAAVWQALLDVAATLQDGRDYTLTGETRVPELRGPGRRRLSRALDDLPAARALPADWRMEWVREHYAVQALRALHVLRRDEHYVLQDDKVVIVDEFTGRLLPDRSWELGLHQLVEVKEGLAPTGQNRTLARLTYQTFFARYLRLAGMSGTLREVARETAALYRVRTVRVQPHRPSQRRVWPTLLLPDAAAKQQALVAEVRRALAAGQAVLVGTRSVQASTAVAQALAAAGVPHRVLNALQDADEAALVASAGAPGAVTVATNMAGRGTDIPLHPQVAAAGGLHVLLTEWHESPRIDRQLFGRGARQGDPGSCRAVVALDDELITRHAPAALRTWARRWTVSPPVQPDGTAAASPRWGVRLLQAAVQYSAEATNAAQRAATWRHDRQMRRQLAFSGVAE